MTEITVYTDDAVRVMDSGLILPESVQCVVSSPPYFGLRDYGVEPVDWPGTGPVTFGAETVPDCLAWAMGLGPCPNCYVCHTRMLFRRLHRILRRDGVVWWVLGDSYAGSGRGPSGRTGFQNAEVRQGFTDPGATTWPALGLKRKDLIGIPYRVAMALQRDGWWWRQDVVWWKPNSIPESVRDRCARSHETVLMFSKSATYYYDRDALAEPESPASTRRYSSSLAPDGRMGISGLYRNAREGGAEGHGLMGRTRQGNIRPPTDGLRRARDVWPINTTPYRGAHFAVFPKKLADRMVRAGSRPGDTVFDPFTGSGTTLICAHRTGRNSIGVEKNAGYVSLLGNRIARDLGSDVRVSYNKLPEVSQ